MSSRVERFLTELARLEQGAEASGELDPVCVGDIMTDCAVDAASLKGLVTPAKPQSYTRNLIARTAWYDVICMVWGPLAGTPIHDHSGQRGWVQLVEGALREETFELAGAPEAVTMTGSGEVREVGAIATVDRQRAIHRIGNIWGGFAVSLHVYSLPHDQCRVYSAEGDLSRCREMRFDSVPAGLENEVPTHRATQVRPPLGGASGGADGQGDAQPHAPWSLA